MTTIDLIPENLHHKRRQRRRRRRWMQLSAGIIVALVAIGAVAEHRAMGVRRTLARTEEAIATTATLHREIEGLLAEIRLVNDKLLDAQRLLGEHRWSRPLALLASALPETVLLTEIHTVPPAPQTATSTKRRRRDKDAPAEERSPDTVRALAIRGVALDSQALMDLLEALKRSDGFGRVLLEETRRTPVLGESGVEFSLRCEW